MKKEIEFSDWKIAVVIPSFRVKKEILKVINKIPMCAQKIYVVDDNCPEKTGHHVKSACFDRRVEVIILKQNKGVGGAVKAGYLKAIADGYEVIVKVDGDDQMDPTLIPKLIEPIINGEADYSKGNRFYNLEGISEMPLNRLIGNTFLSFITKISSGYWNIFDPTNGFTAIHAEVCSKLPLQKISNRYFFETDMLFRLNICRAVVIDYPMSARYRGEVSSLKINKIFIEFIVKNGRNFFKRIFYNYYLRDLSLASIELPLGILMTAFGIIYGGYKWYLSDITGISNSAGTVMIAAILIIIGMQFILSFIAYDISSVPNKVLHKFFR